MYCKSMNMINVSEELIKKKFTGDTTDGEAVNTDRKAGLWKIIEDISYQLIIPITNIWCVCHRSDLTMEDLERYIPELNMEN